MNKKFRITLVMTLAWLIASCGNKTAQGGDNDSTAVADSAVAVATAPAELWTVEAVEAQVRKIYDRLNDMDKNGIINVRQLEDEFCTSYYLGLRDAISKAMENVKGDGRMFFGDEEGYRFLAGLGTPLEIETIKADLLPGDMAQAQVRFKGADEENGFMRLELDFENGQWRVKNFDQPEAFGPGGYLKIMEDFAGEHGISYEGIASPKGDDSDAATMLTYANMEGIYDTLDDKMSSVSRICLNTDGTATWCMVGSLNYTEYTYRIEGNTICMKAKGVNSEEECYEYDSDTRTLKNEQGAVYYRQVEE